MKPLSRNIEMPNGTVKLFHNTESPLENTVWICTKGVIDPNDNTAVMSLADIRRLQIALRHLENRMINYTKYNKNETQATAD